MNETLIINVYCSMVLAQNCTADDILVSPDLRHQFLSAIQEHNSALTEKYILERLIYLRKKGRLPRSRSLLATKDDPK